MRAVPPLGIEENQHLRRHRLIAVLIGSLGYFVDVYDLMLFTIVRIPSFQSIGVPEAERMAAGIFILNVQMIGMLLGGFLWGVLGDKKGRLSTLVGSILLYSVANFLNAFVHSVDSYAALRFIAGVGLAGELGAAVTLVSELLPTSQRGYGTTLVAMAGALGGIFAAIVGKTLDWRLAYVLGGVMGITILVLRINLVESGLFQGLAKNPRVRRGDLRLLLGNPRRALRYLYCILIGVPFTYFFGILVTFSPEISQQAGFAVPVSAASAMLYANIGVTAGDLLSGLLCQVLKKRRPVIALFLLVFPILAFTLLFAPGLTPSGFYAITLGLGMSVGFWAVLLTLASEQFGTNLRATVATSVPNCVRGVLVILTLSFQFLKNRAGYSLSASALGIGLVCILLALFSVSQLEESFSKDLDFVET